VVQPPQRRSCAPAYASLPEDFCLPWLSEDDPCAKRQRLDLGSPRQEWARLAAGDAGQPWVDVAGPCPVALALEGTRLKQQRWWPQEEQAKRRRLEPEARLPRLPRRQQMPTPSCGPRAMVPGENDIEASAFSWGDLSGLSATAPDQDLHVADITDGTSCSGDRTTLPSCTALVPYRKSATASTFTQEPVSFPLALTPVVPLPIAEVALRGETAVALPEVAAQHRGKPGAEEQVIPWGRDLAIVLYRGPGCNIEPDSTAPAQTEASYEDEEEGMEMA